MLEDAKTKLFKTELTEIVIAVLTLLNDFELIICGLIVTGIFAFSSGDFRGVSKTVAKTRNSINQISKESTQLLTQAGAISARIKQQRARIWQQRPHAFENGE